MTQTPFFSPSHGIHTARAIYALGLKKTKLFSPRSLLSHGFLMCIVKQKSQTLELNQIFVPFTFAFSLYVVFRDKLRDKLA